MNSLSHEQRQAVVRSIRQFASADGGLERLPDEVLRVALYALAGRHGDLCRLVGAWTDRQRGFR